MMRHECAFALALLVIVAATLSALAYTHGPVSATLSDMTTDYPSRVDPTLTAAPTRWPYPIVVTGTALALTERAEFHATYSAWWTRTPAAPWPFALPVTATQTVGATMTTTTSPTPAPRVTSTVTAAPTGTPVLFPCRFTPTRCGTRAWLPFSGRGRRR